MSDEELSGDEMLDQTASQIEQALSEDIVDDVADSDDVVDEVDDYEDDDQEDIEVDDDDESDDPYAALDDFERSEMERARLGGWRPKSEYKGDPKNWKDYDEFNAVGDRIVSNLNTKIDAQSKKIEQQQQAIQKLLKAQGS